VSALREELGLPELVELDIEYRAPR
jgi:hypothetical protein